MCRMALRHLFIVGFVYGVLATLPVGAISMAAPDTYTDALSEKLEEADRDVFLRMCVAARDGKNVERVVASLVRLLQDSSPKVRRRAADLLGAFPLKEEDTARALVRLASAEKDTWVRCRAVAALGRFHSKTAMNHLRKAVSDPEPLVRAHAIQGLHNMGADAAEAVPELIAALQDDGERTFYNGGGSPSKPVRRDAALALGAIGKGAGAAVVALSRMAKKDSNPIVRSAAASALVLIDEKHAFGLDLLAKLMKHPKESVRENAASDVRSLGPKAKPLIPVMIEGLHDEGDLVRCFSAHSLETIGVGNKLVVTELINALSDDSGLVRKSAADALGGLGKQARSAVSALARTLHEEHDDPCDDNVQIVAGRALTKVAPPDIAVPLLIKRLRVEEDKWGIVRLGLVEVLGNLGGDAALAIPELENLRKDASPRMRDSIDKARRKILAGKVNGTEQ
jgi:HEAT repeat protein